MINCGQILRGITDAPCEKDICCLECPGVDICTIRCGNLSKFCRDRTEVEEQAEEEPEAETADPLKLMRMDSRTNDLITAIANLTTQKKAIEDQEKAMKEKLLEAMEKYGVKSFDCDQVKFTYVGPTTRTTLDSAKLKKDLPDVAAKYAKTSNVKASVRIEVKKD